MADPDCRYCGAEFVRWDGPYRVWACGTRKVRGGTTQSIACSDRQLEITATSDYGEPWKLTTIHNGIVELSDCNDQGIIWSQTPALTRLMERMAACVNACAGIPNETLKEPNHGNQTEQCSRPNHPADRQ